MEAKASPALEPRHGSGSGNNSSNSSGPVTKDIWMLLSSMDATAPNKKDGANSATDGLLSSPSSLEERDTFTLLVGAKSAGKTSLCNAYIYRGESSTSSDKSAVDDVKPTTGLEYLFVRQSGAVAHMWELAATRCVPEMMRVPLAPERIFQSACVIVVDLSVPGDALPYLLKWLTTLHKLVGDVLKTKEKNPVDKATVERLRRQALARYGHDHADRDDVSPIAVPVLIVGTKYDVFAKEDSARRKPLQQALRFFAHLFGATLLFTSVKEKPSVVQLRTVLKSYVFGTSPNLQTLKKETDAVAKPLFVPAGSDRFDDIGLPDGTRKEDVLASPVSDVDAKGKPWKKYVAKVFEPSGAVTDGWDVAGDAKDAKGLENEFPEPNVDRARQRKLEELQRYREASRKKGDKAKAIKA